MKRLMCAGLWLGFAAGVAFGQVGTFPYEAWTSEDGKVIEARLIKVTGETVTLQMKKGGKRYAVKRGSLSKESNAALDSYRERVRKEIAGGTIGTTTIYQSVVLGLGEESAAALVDKDLRFGVTGFRIDTDRKGAYLELDEALFLKVSAPARYELYDKQDALYARPIRKNPNEAQRAINEGARLMARKGAQYKVHFTPKTLFEFGTVGITDGVIVHR